MEWFSEISVNNVYLKIFPETLNNKGCQFRQINKHKFDIPQTT